MWEVLFAFLAAFGFFEVPDKFYIPVVDPGTVFNEFGFLGHCGSTID